MARKPAITDDAETIELSDDIQETPAEKEDMDFERAVLAQFEQEGEAEWRILVDRMPVDSKGIVSASNGERLYEMDKSEFSHVFQRIRDEFGTGAYRFLIYRGNRLWKRQIMRIRVPETKTPVAAPQSDMAAVLAEIRAANERTVQALERAAERNSQSAMTFDPVKMFAQVATTFQAFQSMMPQPAKTESKDAAQVFIEGVKFARELEPPERGSGMTGILERLLDSPLLAKIAEGIQSPPQVPQMRPAFQPGQPAPLPLGGQHAVPQARPVPGPSGGQAPASPSSPVPSPAQGSPVMPISGAANETEAMGALPIVNIPTPQEFATYLAQNPQLQAQLQGAVDYLLTRAVAGSDAGYYAEWVYDNWPIEFIDVILQIPDLYVLLASLQPLVSGHEIWFRALIDELRQIVKDDGASVQTGNTDASVGNASPINAHGHSGRPGGSAGNAQDHVAPSQGGKDKSGG